MSPPKEDQFSFQVKAFVLQNSIDYLHIKYLNVLLQIFAGYKC